LAAPARHHRDPVPLLERRPRPEDFVLTLWTDDPRLAARADTAGVDRIGIDLEQIGKAARQEGLGTWISPHRVEALPALAAATSRCRLFARTNPLHSGTGAEVDALVEAGAEVLMLPMFAGPDEVERFVALVDGRAEVVLLLELAEAAEAIDDVLAVDGVGEVHVGINDLSLDLGLPNRFLALAHPLTDHVAQRVRAAGARFGIGGIGRAGDAGLPIRSELIYAQYARLGATAALIARAFVGSQDEHVDLAAEVALARAELARWFTAPPEQLLEARDELVRAATARTRW
jgi:hypothetical protein